jgi:RHS repeat-associated protein
MQTEQASAHSTLSSPIVFAQMRRYTPPSPRRHHFLAKALLIILFGLLIAPYGLAQGPNSQGIEPFSTQTGSAFESLNLSSSQMLITLPLGRTKNGPIAFSFALRGNPNLVPPPPSQGTADGAFQVYPTLRLVSGVDLLQVLVQSVAAPTTCQPTPTTTLTFNDFNDLAVVDSTGAAHPFSYSVALYFNPCTNTYSVPLGTSTMTSDGSGYTVVLTTLTASGAVFTVYDKSGNKIPSPGTLTTGQLSMTTPNGVTAQELYTSSGDFNSVTQYTDPLGPNVIQDQQYTSLITLSSSIGVPVVGEVFSYQDSSDQTQQITSYVATFMLQENFASGVGGQPTTSGAQILPTEVVLADGRAYTFTYEPTPGFPANTTGRIASIGLPDGGTISYNYKNSSGNTGIYIAPLVPGGSSEAILPTLTRTMNDANGHQSVWKYVFSQPPTAPASRIYTTTTVTDPSGNTTVYQFANGYQTEQQTYQGASGGTLLKTVLTCYNGNFSNCAAPTNLAPPVFKITQTDVYTSYNSGPYALVETLYNVAGMPTDVKQYDFGAGMPASGTILSETITSYGTWNGTSCVALSGYIYDHPCQAKVQGPSGLVSDKRNTYDMHGNLTQTSSLATVGTTPSTATATYVTQSFAYDPNGALNKITDANQNITTISNGDCNDLLPTSRTANGFTWQETWDCNGGVITSTTGLNAGETTSYQYNDPLYRLTSVQRPSDSGTTTTCYSDVGGSSCTQSSTANMTYTFTTASPDPTIETITTLDGLGRVIAQQIASAPGGPITITTAYDAVGRIAGVSNPERTYAGATDGAITYTFDALSRPLLQCNQDNAPTTTPTTACAPGTSYKKWTYSAATTDVYDEAAHHWQQTVDGMGRLIAVKEPDASNSPTIETDYTYDPQSNLLEVDQYGGPKGSSSYTERVRTFTYDGLSRLLCAANPETSTAVACPATSGVMAYSYDGNGNVTGRSDPRGVVTQYFYDALNRITSKQYTTKPAGVAPTSNVYYVYDYAIQGWGWPVQTSPSYPSDGQTNVVGRLTSAATQAVGGAQAWTVYGYDVSGRMILKSECLPVDCGSNHHDMHFQYDQAGQLTYYERGLDVDRNNSTPNAGYYFGGYHQSYDAAGNLNQVTGDTSGPNRATNIFSNPVYFPTGQQYTAQLLGLYNDKYSVTPRVWYTGEFITDQAAATVWQSSASHNNTGTVGITTDKGAGNWTYTYDPMNRLSTAHGPVGDLTYAIDPFGNKTTQTITWGTAPSQSSMVATTNALTSNGLTYDLNPTLNGIPLPPRGNITYDGHNQYTYDAEGRLYMVDTSTCYIYDGDGDRVARTNCNVTGAGAATTGVLAEFLYDPNHRLMAEVNPATAQIARANIYAGSRLVAEDSPDSFVTSPTATQMRVTDQVGTLRGLVDLGEHITTSCTSFPFGDGTTCSNSADTEFFTGKQRDTVSDLDYFGARYYNSTLGRFMSPDPSGLAYADPSNPQSLNLYSYAQNDPLVYIDPTGMQCSDTEASGNQFGGGPDGDSPTYDSGPPACAQDQGTPVPTILHQDGNVSYQQTVEVSGSAPSSDLALLQAGSNGGSSGSHVPANAGNAPNNAPCKTGFNFGVAAGADGGAGLGFNPLQLGAMIGGAAGFTFGGAHPFGLFASGSGGAAAGGRGAPAQGNNFAALGGGAAAGVGVTFGNATSAGQMRGNALTFGGGVDVGIGGGVQVTLGTDAAGNTIWQVSITGGPGAKFYGYSLKTHTVAASTNKGC